MKKNFIKKLSFSIGALGIGFTSYTALELYNPTEASAASTTTHTVQKGDTLWSISVKYNTTVDKIKSLNNLSSDIILTGQNLIINGTDFDSNSNSNTPTTTHTVQNGDTLYSLSLNYGISVENIKFLNNLDSNTIYIGQILKIKNTTNSTPPSSGTSSDNTSNNVVKGYTKTYMSYGTQIHVYVSDSDDVLDISYGVQGKLEPLSNIKVVGEKAKANLGFFDVGYEHSGLFYKDTTVYQGTRQRHVVAVFTKDKRLLLRDFGNTLTQDDKNWLYQNALVAFGTSYELVNSGKIYLYNSSQFSHANTKNPRTMLGQLPDGRLVLAVTDGRETGSAGLTAAQQASFMQGLGVYNAVNLDGGGSSELIHGGIIRNKLQGNIERSIGSAIFIKD